MMVSSDSEYSDEEFSSKVSQHKSLAQHFNCPNCPLTSLSLKSYNRHLRSHLACYSAYECKECLVSFHDKEVYLQHRGEEIEKKRHSKLNNNLVCAMCKKQFFTVCAFNRHKLRHQGAPYKCPICKEMFPSFSSRSRHVKNHVVKCSLCNIYFQDNPELMNHISLVHRSKDKIVKIEPIVPISTENISELESEVKEIPWSEKKYICFVCEQRFHSEESMNSHLRAHKVFACSECSRFFPCLSHLQEHILSHRDVQDEGILDPVKNSYQPGTIAKMQTFESRFPSEDLDKSERPMLDFDNLLHFNWLIKFVQEIQAFDLPLPIPVSEKLFHVTALLTKQLTYPTGLVDMGKNFEYFAYILKILQTVAIEHFFKLAELKKQ